MAVNIKRVPNPDDERRKRIEAHLKDGCLPIQTYKGGGMFDLLHEPLNGKPCQAVEIDGKVWCMEDDHLFPVPAGRDTAKDPSEK